MEDEITSSAEKEQKSQVALNEERILARWKEKSIFEKTLAKNADGKEFVFYDGPPFATGLPHYGHLIPGTIKDSIPRFKTMQGFYVRRQWGWDCHGLPVENLVEKELNLKNKKDIEDFGIEKFNKAARDSVMRYASEWQEIIPRTGRFVNMKDDYKTMDTSYTESVWWAFSELHKKNLAYEGFKIMPYCPRCGTTLSNFEVNQGYKDIADISVYAKFKLKESENTYFLAWTTTPWTLPGNVALAVNPDVTYAYIKIDENVYILAHDRIKDLVAKKIIPETFHVNKKIEGRELIGNSYEPVFDYYTHQKLENKDNAWKIYGASFVTTEDGTGIVHIAPAFGADDYDLALKERLPVIIHVNKDGVFKDEVTDFKGQFVKPRSDHQKGDVEIIKNLAHRGLLFAKEKMVHSYPHCWRCDTPLLNYASSSWFVKVTDLKSRLLRENKKVNWIPSHIQEGRFGKWLEGARDWAVSRSRYWGAPIPVWKCDVCENIYVAGSIADIKEKIQSTNKYFLVRHGEAQNNVQDIINSHLENNTFELTEKGRGQAANAASSLKHKKIDVVYVSPFMRAQKTAKIICEVLGIDESKIKTDNRLSEINAGSFEGKTIDEYHEYFLEHPDRFALAPEGGENYLEVRRRMMEFMYDIDKKHSSQNILIISHDTPLWLFITGVHGMSAKETLLCRGKSRFFLPNAEVREVTFSPLPHNEYFDLDLHRPYIDNVEFPCVCKKGTMKRIPEVFDTWFDSGSMVFARHHYMGKALPDFDPKGGLLRSTVGFPADFIAEGLDQTRGWFYTLIVLSTALFDKVPYKNVVVNGLLLAEDGRKMSKSLKNYPEISTVLNKYGADALRYFLMSSPLVHAEDVSFSEKNIDEIYKKLILRLNNVVSFYEMFNTSTVKEGEDDEIPTSKNILDEWILSRLGEVIEKTTAALEAYELDKACWPFESFIDDLSTWYLRRSRDRFKEDGDEKNTARAVLCYVLLTFSKVIAPIMPFVADDIYTRTGGKKESVHLEDWPKNIHIHAELLLDMKNIRTVVSQALEARSKSGVKVRQPLQKLSIKTAEFSKDMLDLIKDEVNVKEVVVDEKLSHDVVLDTKLTEELKREGQFRELLRGLQEFRKKRKLVPHDRIVLGMETSTEGIELVRTFELEMRKVAGLEDIKFTAVLNGEEITADTLLFKVDIIS